MRGDGSDSTECHITLEEFVGGNRPQEGLWQGAGGEGVARDASSGGGMYIEATKKVERRLEEMKGKHWW